MQQGGNAVDAAVAIAFALEVVFPRRAISAAAVSSSSAAPMATSISSTTARRLPPRPPPICISTPWQCIPGMSTLGYKAIGVPGSVAGLAYAQRHWGKLSLKQVMEPAIRLARDGYVLTYDEAKGLQDPDLEKFPESHRIFQRDGNYYQPGEVFKQLELAKTLGRIADNPDDFYHGAMAHELAAAIQKGGGLITAEDLAQYQTKERQPIRGTYRGYEIISAPPPSSGGIALVEILNILEGYDLAKQGDGLGREHPPYGRSLSARVFRSRRVPR